jgi:hypothetical protein
MKISTKTSGIAHGMIDKLRSAITILAWLIISCSSHKAIDFAPRQSNSITGPEFYRQASTFGWKERDSLAVREILKGNVPSFFREFEAIQTSIKDDKGKIIKATYYVSPDYLGIGNDSDWARIPLTPMAAQQIADTLNCFLPTRKIVNDIYASASVKLEPVPMFAYRDSTPTMYHHHLIIEGLRNQRRGLIAGIKKDVVISGKISRDTRPNRVAIYGWHKPDGKPIQPLYTGHVNWYVDYSHGIRLIYEKIKVDGRWMDYKDVLKDPVLQKLICDEEYCDYYRY